MLDESLRAIFRTAGLEPALAPDPGRKRRFV